MERGLAKTSPAHLLEAGGPKDGLGLRRLLLAWGLLLGISAAFFFDLSFGSALQTLQARRDQLLVFANTHYAMAVVFFIGVYCLQTAFSLPGDVPLTLMAGYLFGSVLGTIYVNIGATAGATLAFLAARYLFRDWVEGWMGARLDRLQRGFEQSAFGYLLTLRLIPAVPFVVLNLVSGLTRVSLRTYVGATALGILPCSFVYAYAGRQLGVIHSVAEITSPQVLLSFALLALLALGAAVYPRK